MNWDNPFQSPLSNNQIAEQPQQLAEANTQKQVSEVRSEELSPYATQSPPVAEQESFKESLEPIDVEDKRVVNAKVDINQLAPFKYKWAWEFFLNGNKNHWTPLDTNMNDDVYDYHHKLNDNERHVFENVFAYLTTSDILAMRNVAIAVMEKMTAPELQIYQARQVFDEALHTWTYQHCIETLNLDQSEIYNRYRVVPAIYRKIKTANKRLDAVMSPTLDLSNRDDLQTFAMSYAFFATVFEGTWFYNGFSPIFSLQRRGLMKSTGKQLQYIMRDEIMHYTFGVNVINTLMKEENLKLDPKEHQLMWEEAESCEFDYINYVLPVPILGYNTEDHMEQFRFIANRRAAQIGQKQPFPGAKETLKWLDEQAKTNKEGNFFETRVIDYQKIADFKF